MAGSKNLLLANHLRHAGTHNKVQEEREMWRLRKLELNNSTSLADSASSSISRTPITTGRLLSDSYQETEQGEYEEEKDGNGRGIAQTRAELPTSSHYWTRQLMKAEEADSHRWGHAGYKELHPEEFVSTDEEKEKKRVRVKRKRSKGEKKKKVKLKRRKRSFSSDEGDTKKKKSSRKKHLKREKN